jgi:hypothetical protein
MTSVPLDLKRDLTSLTKSPEGNAAVEFSLATPVLIMIAIGALDYGVAYVEGLRLSGAAHAGAGQALYDAAGWENTDDFERTALEEYAGHPLSDDQIAALPVSAVAEAFCGCDDGSNLDCSASCPSGSTPNRLVRVTLSRDVQLMLPYPWASNGSLAVAGDAVVRVR